MRKAEFIFPGIRVSCRLHWNHTPTCIHTVGYMLDHIRHICAASYSVFQTSGLLHFGAGLHQHALCSEAYPVIQPIGLVCKIWLGIWIWNHSNLTKPYPERTWHCFWISIPKEDFVLYVLQTGLSDQIVKFCCPLVWRTAKHSKWPPLNPKTYEALHFWETFITRESTGPGASCPLCV